MKLKLEGLDASQTYEVRDFDRDETLSFSGKDLMQSGLSVTLGSRGAAVFSYKIIQPPPKK